MRFAYRATDALITYVEDRMSTDSIALNDGRPTPVDAREQEHTLARTIGLHLLPGVLATLVYLLVTR